jgi:Zn-dependent M28 family amino/carboxypeptidase
MKIRNQVSGIRNQGWARGQVFGISGGVSVVVAALLLTCSVLVLAQTAAPSKTRAHVQTLASERFGGREAGTDGERLAGDYIAAQLARVGAKPLPGRRDMFESFQFTAGARDGGSKISIGWTPGSLPAGDTIGFIQDADSVRALSFSDDAEVTAGAVFAGYGIVVPDSQNFGYDSYATLDVKDKIVVVLRYFPEDADKDTKAILARYSDLRYKAMQARQHGAKAMLVITGPRSPNAGELVPMTFDTAIAGSGIPAASVHRTTAAALFRTSGKSLADAQKDLDSGNPHVAGFELPNTIVTLKTAVQRVTHTARNVVAYLPATGSTAAAGRDARSGPAVQKPWIIVGAHYDHLGRGEGGNSLASKEDAGKPHLGADDNASGTATVLAVAEALSKVPMRTRNVVLALWSAEELGLVGSAEFAGKPPLPIDQIDAYINFDMVGRMQENKLTAQATGSSPSWPAILERANVAAGFDLTLQEDPYQPTDVASFNGAGVPSLSFTTGAHVDYHKPSDTADKIDYVDLDRVADFATAIVRRLMETEPPQFAKVEQSQQSASRTGVRVFTGTVPDYTSNAKGLLLGGVIGGGPAEQAGLQKGDIIVEIAGQSIANIYDYTYALELLKIGEPVKVVYERAGMRHETTLTPGARK